MLYYLNNWKNRDHAGIYGGDAFFDLWADGVEDKRTRELVAGDTCLVLSRRDRNNVAVTCYTFARAKRAPPDPGTNRGVWVLEGALERREVLLKVDAAQHKQYARFFNKLGHVNQWSVLREA